ncbi:MAG: hypothetical protein R2857_05220 [Vampirovibrionales bacterium]
MFMLSFPSLNRLFGPEGLQKPRLLQSWLAAVGLLGGFVAYAIWLAQGLEPSWSAEGFNLYNAWVVYSPSKALQLQHALPFHHNYGWLSGLPYLVSKQQTILSLRLFCFAAGFLSFAGVFWSIKKHLPPAPDTTRRPTLPAWLWVGPLGFYFMGWGLAVFGHHEWPCILINLGLITYLNLMPPHGTQAAVEVPSASVRLFTVAALTAGLLCMVVLCYTPALLCGLFLTVALLVNHRQPAFWAGHLLGYLGGAWVLHTLTPISFHALRLNAEAFDVAENMAVGHSSFTSFTPRVNDLTGVAHDSLQQALGQQVQTLLKWLPADWRSDVFVYMAEQFEPLYFAKLGLYFGIGGLFAVVFRQYARRLTAHPALAKLLASLAGLVSIGLMLICHHTNLMVFLATLLFGMAWVDWLGYTPPWRNRSPVQCGLAILGALFVLWFPLYLLKLWPAFRFYPVTLGLGTAAVLMLETGLPRLKKWGAAIKHPGDWRHPNQVLHALTLLSYVAWVGLTAYVIGAILNQTLITSFSVDSESNQIFYSLLIRWGWVVMGFSLTLLGFSHGRAGLLNHPVLLCLYTLLGLALIQVLFGGIIDKFFYSSEAISLVWALGWVLVVGLVRYNRRWSFAQGPVMLFFSCALVIALTARSATYYHGHPPLLTARLPVATSTVQPLNGLRLSPNGSVAWRQPCDFLNSTTANNTHYWYDRPAHAALPDTNPCVCRKPHIGPSSKESVSLLLYGPNLCVQDIAHANPPTTKGLAALYQTLFSWQTEPIGESLTMAVGQR